MTARLLSQLAHDLRSPLTVMGGALNELESAPSELGESDRAKMFSLSRRAVARLLTLSDRLDLAARVGHGLSATLGHHDLTALTREAVDAFSREQLHPRIALNTVWPHARVLAKVDHRLLSTLLSELLTNANRFARSQVTVEVANGHGISVCVDDDGPGVAENERGNLFQPFAERSERHGLGMGLWLARSLAELHHGSLTVEPRSPGTRQRFWIPVQP